MYSPTPLVQPCLAAFWHSVQASLPSRRIHLSSLLPRYLLAFCRGRGGAIEVKVMVKESEGGGLSAIGDGRDKSTVRETEESNQGIWDDIQVKR